LNFTPAASSFSPFQNVTSVRSLNSQVVASIDFQESATDGTTLPLSSMSVRASNAAGLKPLYPAFHAIGSTDGANVDVANTSFCGGFGAAVAGPVEAGVTGVAGVQATNSARRKPRGPRV
jgi:hypothetical protein